MRSIWSNRAASRICLKRDTEVSCAERTGNTSKYEETLTKWILRFGWCQAFFGSVIITIVLGLGGKLNFLGRDPPDVFYRTSYELNLIIRKFVFLPHEIHESCQGVCAISLLLQNQEHCCFESGYRSKQ